MLPEWRRNVLGDFDQELNKLEPRRLSELYKEGKVVSMIDRGMAIGVASKGVSVGFLPSAVTMLFPLCLIAIPVLLFFVDWWYSVVAFVAAIIMFNWSRRLTTRAVRKRALRDPELMGTLMELGVLWFEAKETTTDLVAEVRSQQDKVAIDERDEPNNDEVTRAERLASAGEAVSPAPLKVLPGRPHTPMKVPSRELLRQMNEDELKEVWEARPLVQWAPEIHVMGPQERWLYFKDHVEMAFWEMPLEFLNRVTDRLLEEEKSSQTSDISARQSNNLHIVQSRRYSDNFLAALARAKSHIDSCVQDGTVSWLLSAREGPSIHHLGFRIGNQLFLGQLTSANINDQDFEGNRQALLTFCAQAKAHPFILPLESEGRAWNVVESGWGLLHAETGEELDPFPLVGREAVVMSDFEIQDFAVQIVLKELEKAGHKILSAQGSPDLDPSIWFADDDGSAWVCIRVARYPSPNPSPPENTKSIQDNLAADSVGGYFASVGVANANDPFIPDRPQSAYPLRRGEGLVVRFSGIEKITN